MRAARGGALAAAVLGLGLMTGCSSASDGAPSTTPAGAIVLTQNVKTSLDGGEIVATNFADEGSRLAIVEPGKTARNVDVHPGDEVQVVASTYRVEAIWSVSGSGAGVGAGEGRLMLVPTS